MVARAREDHNPLRATRNPLARASKAHADRLARRPCRGQAPRRALARRRRACVSAVLLRSLRTALSLRARSHGPRYGSSRGRGAGRAIARAAKPRELPWRGAALHLAVRDLPQPRSRSGLARAGAAKRTSSCSRIIRTLRAAVDSLVSAGDDPEAELEREQRARYIQVALDRLPPRYGDALEWKYVEGFSAQEIAARLNIGLEAANSLLARAKRAFKETYAAMLELRAAIGERSAMSDAREKQLEEPGDDLADVVRPRRCARAPERSRRSGGVRGAARRMARAHGGAPAAPRCSRFAAAAAASLAVAALGYLWLQSRTPSAPATLATIELVEGGDVTWRDDRSQVQPLGARREFAEGQRLATGPGIARRAALARRRLVAPRFELAARARVCRRRATDGRQPVLRFGRRRRAKRRSAPTLAVQTPAGEVVHIGTQFMVTRRGRRGRAQRSRRAGQGHGRRLRARRRHQRGARFARRRHARRDRDRRPRRALGVGGGRRSADRARRPHDVRRRRVGRARDRPARRLRDADGRDASPRRRAARHRSAQPPSGILTLLPHLTGLAYEIRDDAIVVSEP